MSIQQGLSSPAKSAAAVTPNDNTDLTNAALALYVGGAGTVAVHMKDNPGTSVSFVGAVAGSVLPIQVVRVLSTGTTATSIVALY